MPRRAKLKPNQLRGKWCVNVPASLSDTGKRRQLFFDTKGQAQTHCEKLKTQKQNFGVSLNAMTPARIAEAGEAFKILDPIGMDLLEAVRFAASAHKARSASVTFKALFEEFLSEKQDRHPRYLEQLRISFSRFSELNDRIVPDITPREIEATLRALTPGARNPIMRYLKTLFKFGIKRGYLAECPIDKLDFVRRPRREVETVPVEQVSRMLNCALENDLKLLPFLTFGFFCGIRPEGELMELEWSDVKEDEIVIRPEISKTNRRRFVEMSDNARAWLNAYGDRGGEMTGKVVSLNLRNLQRRHRLLRRAAGISHWPQQGARHTFCSCWLAVHKDVNKLVLMSGHDSVDTMWRAYHAGIPEADAKRFWAIMPPTADSKIIRMTATA